MKVKLKECSVKLFKLNLKHISRYKFKLKRGRKSFTCYFCGITSKSPLHYCIHTGELPYKCQNCHQRFRHSETLKTHRERKHSNNRNRKSECSICNKTYGDKSALENHIKYVHKGGKERTNVPQQCPFCPKTLCRKSVLVLHIKNIHKGEKNHKCPHCPLKFSTKGRLKYHTIISTCPEVSCVGLSLPCRTLNKEHQHALHPRQFEPTRVLTSKEILAKTDKSSKIGCPYCSRRYDMGESALLIRHVRYFHEGGKERRYIKQQCPHCSKMLGCITSLQQHIRVVHKRQFTHQCGFCNQKFPNKTELEQHTRRHTGEKDLQTCKEPGCGLIFNCQPTARAHRLKAHPKETDTTEFNCKFCAKSYTWKRSLDWHVKVSHKYGKSDRPFACTLCERSYFDNRSLEDHISTVHTSEKAFKCGKCGKCFHSDMKLRIHVARHRDLHNRKAHVCEYCGEIYNIKHSLVKHKEKYHLGIDTRKLQKCYFCGVEKSSGNTGMAAHLPIHTGERPHKCEVCFRNYFKTSHELRVHFIKEHGIGHGTWKCYFCNANLSCSSALRRHLSIHTREKAWKCGNCKKAFKRYWDMVLHCRNHVN